MATLELLSVSKSFGTAKAVRDVSLSVSDGEFVVFVGPSGCGKSTLLRLVAGLEEASSGRILIDGRDVGGEAPAERGVSMVFQSYALYPHMNVFENIAFPLRVMKLREPELSERVNRAAETLQLTDRLHLRPGRLSGGQRQRVAIGRSIVREPGIFLFDEPLSNLDASLRGDMRVELAQLHRKLDATMIYVTHDQVEAMTMADRIVVLRDGAVEQIGAPLRLYHHPETRFVAGFIGHPGMNFLPAMVLGASESSLAVELDGGTRLELPVAADGASAGDRVEIGLRPEDAALSEGEGSGLAMKVSVLERLGGASVAYGELAGGVGFRAALDGDVAVGPGDVAKLEIAPEAAHAFDVRGRAMRRLRAPAIANAPEAPVP